CRSSRPGQQREELDHGLSADLLLALRNWQAGVWGMDGGPVAACGCRGCRLAYLLGPLPPWLGDSFRLREAWTQDRLGGSVRRDCQNCQNCHNRRNFVEISSALARTTTLN